MSAAASPARAEIDSDDQVAWEGRAGRLAAFAAVLAVLLFGVGTAVAVRSPRTVADLLTISAAPARYLASGAAGAAAVLCVAVAVAFLLRATRYRRAQTPAYALPLLVFGAVAAAVGLLGQRIDMVVLANDIAAGTPRRAPLAGILRQRVELQILFGLNLAGILALVFTLLVTSVNAVRAGLLSRALGILGGVAAMSFLVPLPFIQLALFAWLIALGALYLDRWPGGRGPAWASGQALPWPSVSERNAEIDRRRVAELEADDDEVAGGDDDGAGPADDGRAMEGDDQTVGTADAVGDAPSDGSGPRRSKKKKRGRR